MPYLIDLLPTTTGDGSRVPQYSSWQ